MADETNTIYQKVSGFIRHPDPAGFEPLALRVFAFQFERNLPYRRYCESLGKTPETVASWREIPAVPTAAFKELDLACGPPQAIFQTSGTSQGKERRGRHLIPRLDLYRASILSNFSAHVLPDRAPLRMLILTGSPDPPEAGWPHSSLAHMMEVVRQEYGHADSRYFIDASGPDLDGLLKALAAAAEQTEPVLLLGITVAFHELLEHCRKRRVEFRLPAGSRIMDTGGYKGRKINLSKTELYARYEDTFGVSQSHIVNEYGMTEMGSQFYDNVLADHLQGRSRPRHKRIPPWVRTLVLDPETLEEVPTGTTGLLRHYDLANCGSVMSLQTEDIGHAVGDGFEITGRTAGAESRGCALMVEELLRTR